jgi:hypothetical protein
MDTKTTSVKTTAEPVKKIRQIRFTVQLTIPVSNASALGKQVNADMPKDLKLARFYLNAVLKRGGVLVAEEEV